MQPIALPATPSREQIDRLEGEMLRIEAAGGPVTLPSGETVQAVAIETWHEFAEDLVARTILIRAGTRLTGAVHKAEHLNVCYGDITVWTEHGMKRLTGYHVLSSLPGAKRVGHAHADTYWTTVHLNPGNERDIAKLEDALVENADQLQSRRLALIEKNPQEVLP